MKTPPDCVPCILRQVLDGARKVSADEWLQAKILRESMGILQEADWDRSPAEVGYDCIKAARQRLGGGDLYAEEKAALTRRALELEPDFRKQVEAATDPLQAAARLAIFANALDAFECPGVDAEGLLQRALTEPLGIDHSRQFREEVGKARSILYVLDNAGEIVFDKLLIEMLAENRTVTCVVRPRPVMCDATANEARCVGIDKLARIIDVGADLHGVPLALCSKEFKQVVDSCDLVVSKGQANFESLEDSDLNAFYLFVLKCQALARTLEAHPGQGFLLAAAHTPGARARRERTEAREKARTGSVAARGV